MPMHYYWGGAGWGPWMLFHSLIWLLLLALVVAAAVSLWRGSKSGNGSGAKSPLDLLNERYARGEIDREEYLQRKKDILEP